MYSKIGQRIRFLRQQKKWTQEKLAERANISLSFLGHIERGTRKLSVETLVHLATALDCSADELLGTGMQSEANLPLLLEQAARRLSDSAD